MAAPKAGGFKLSLAGAKSKPGYKAPLEKPAKRPRLALGDDEPEDDNKKQEISGWDAAEGGAVDVSGKKKEPEAPRIIPALPTRNWREEAMKRRQARVGIPPAQNGDEMEGVEEKKVQYGLTTFKKDEQDQSASPEAMDTAEDGKNPDDGLTEEQRLEKNALDALLHGKPTDQTVIPIQTEEEVFEQDILKAPDAPTLDAYDAVPVEGFGAALLRGMGWKDGENIGRDKGTKIKSMELKRRPALLGIGAKESAAVGIELGEWGKGSKKKVNVTYNPVTLKNKKTGEMISEEELKARLESQKLVDDKPSRSSKNEDDERRREKRKEKKERDRREDDYDSERRRDRDRRDDRRRDRDRDREDDYPDRERRKEKRYRDDDYSDSDRRREKRRDRDRRERSRSPVDDERRDKRRDRDRRYRSRTPDGDERREKRRERDRRDRDRSRSRDSDDRRKRRRDYDYDDERRRKYKDDKYNRK